MTGVLTDLGFLALIGACFWLCALSARLCGRLR